MSGVADLDSDLVESVSNEIRQVVELVGPDSRSQIEQSRNVRLRHRARIDESRPGNVTEPDDHRTQRGARPVHVVALESVGGPTMDGFLEIENRPDGSLGGSRFDGTIELRLDPFDLGAE